MLNGKQSWVVVADSSACKIYEYDFHPEKMRLIKKINHPENQLKDIDLAMDRRGSNRHNAGCGNFEASDPKKNNIDAFSRQIANALDDFRKSQNHHFILISPPKMSGRIHQHLNKHVKRLMDLNIQKDLIHYNDSQLLQFIHQQTHIH